MKLISTADEEKTNGAPSQNKPPLGRQTTEKHMNNCNFLFSWFRLCIIFVLFTFTYSNSLDFKPLDTKLILSKAFEENGFKRDYVNIDVVSKQIFDSINYPIDSELRNVEIELISVKTGPQDSGIIVMVIMGSGYWPGRSESLLSTKGKNLKMVYLASDNISIDTSIIINNRYGIEVTHPISFNSETKTDSVSKSTYVWNGKEYKQKAIKYHRIQRF